MLQHTVYKRLKPKNLVVERYQPKSHNSHRGQKAPQVQACDGTAVCEFDVHAYYRFAVMSSTSFMKAKVGQFSPLWSPVPVGQKDIFFIFFGGVALLLGKNSFFPSVKYATVFGAEAKPLHARTDPYTHSTSRSIALRHLVR